MKRLRIIIILFLMMLCFGNIVCANESKKDGGCEVPLVIYDNQSYGLLGLAIQNIDNHFECVGTLQFQESLISFDSKDKLVSNIDYFQNKKVYIRKNNKDFVFVKVEHGDKGQVYYDMLEIRNVE